MTSETLVGEAAVVLVFVAVTLAMVVFAVVAIAVILRWLADRW